MKKILITIASVVIPAMLVAQNYNPYLAQGFISPSPINDVSTNGTGLISFVVGNGGTSPLPLITNQEMLLTITLSRGVPDAVNPLNAIGGNFSGRFNWIYDPLTKSFQGTQNQAIPESFNGGFGNVTIAYKVVSNSFATSPQNGFNVNLTPPAYTNGINTLSDDQLSSYTWTEVKFISHPDFTVVPINVVYSGNLNTNDEVPSGTIYSNPTMSSSNPSACAPSIASNGSYTFSCTVPGVYHFFVNVCAPSPSTICESVPLTITVPDLSGTNAPPAVNPDFTSTLQGNAVIINVKANDQCLNGSTCLLSSPTIATSSTVVGSAVIVNANGTITYTPANGFVGIDSFRYSVCDNQPVPNCVMEWVYIDVLAPGSPNSTTASDDYLQIFNNVTGIGNVLINDHDPEGNLQTVVPQTITLPGIGTLTLFANGDYNFVPDPAFTTYVDFIYTINDNHTNAAMARATLHIVAGPINLALPASMSFFTVEKSSCDALLKWGTIQEKNTSHFNVLRKGENQPAYHIIAKIKMAGNSDLPKAYSYLDTEIDNGTYQYKLEIVDIDGKMSVSDARSLTIECNNNISVFPNPAVDYLNVKINANTKDNYEIKITDIAGKVVMVSNTAIAKGFKVIRLSTIGLASGIYNLMVSNSAEIQSFKITIDHK